MSNPITVTVSESNVSAGASVTVTVLNAAPASGAGKTVVSAGGIADLTVEQQAEVSQGVIVVTTDGLRYIYSGGGSKTDPASYVLLADITPDWSTLSGKPTSFTPASHASAHGSAGVDPITIGISQVTGLQTSLDGKQAAGSYAAASHTHTIANVTGLQTALDGKQPTLPAGVDGGEVLTYSGGQWIPQQPSGGGSSVFKGEWSDSGAYSVGDFVEYSGTIYKNVNNWQNPQPDSDPNYWAPIGGGGGGSSSWKGEYDSTTSYGANDVVTYSGSLYIATMSNVEQYPDNGMGYWNALTGGGGGGGGGLPASPSDGQLAVYSSSAMTWTTSGDSMYLSEVVLASYGNGASSRAVVTFAPEDASSGPGFRVYDSNGMNYTEMNSQYIKFQDGTTQGSAFPGGYTGTFSIYDGSVSHYFEFNNGVLTNYNAA